MVEQEIFRSVIPGVHDVVVYRSQAEVAGYKTLRFRLMHGILDLSDLSATALQDHFGDAMYAQLAASGKLG